MTDSSYELAATQLEFLTQARGWYENAIPRFVVRRSRKEADRRRTVVLADKNGKIPDSNRETAELRAQDWNDQYMFWTLETREGEKYIVQSFPGGSFRDGVGGNSYRKLLGLRKNGSGPPETTFDGKAVAWSTKPSPPGQEDSEEQEFDPTPATRNAHCVSRPDSRVPRPHRDVNEAGLGTPIEASGLSRTAFEARMASSSKSVLSDNEENLSDSSFTNSSPFFH